jgi:tRNA modification GTPase
MDLSPELIAVDLRFAIDSLGALTGEVYTDDILEVLFSRFCIGK